MGDSSKCPLCTRVEDNEHRVKQCPYLEMPIQLVRDLYHPIRDKQGARIEPSRICLEHQQESLESEQGILMWTAIAALWRYRCEVRYQRTTPTRQGFMGWWDGELRRWGQEERRRCQCLIQRARKAIRSWLQNKGKLDRRTDPGIPKEQNRKKARRRGRRVEEGGDREVQPARAAGGRGTESMDRWVPTSGHGRTAICGVWSLVRGGARPELQRPLARPTSRPITERR
jgi:hypothetical protein